MLQCRFLAAFFMSPSAAAELSIWRTMADWFKFYNDGLDEPRFQFAISEQPLVTSVWLVILSEASKKRSSKITWRDQDFELLGFARKVNVSPPVFNQCVELLERIGYIARQNGNIDIPGWEKLQSDYAKGLAKGYYKSTSERLASVSKVSTVRGEESRVEKRIETKDIPPVGGVVGSEHKSFIQGWGENFKAEFGSDYDFSNTRNFKAASKLLKLGILRIDLLELAKSAWRRSKVDPFTSACKRASTIYGFADSLNEIRAELSRPVSAGALKNEQPPTKPGNNTPEARIAAIMRGLDRI
jgi:hypothetical protein